MNIGFIAFVDVLHHFMSWASSTVFKTRANVKEQASNVLHFFLSTVTSYSCSLVLFFVFDSEADLIYYLNKINLIFI